MTEAKKKELRDELRKLEEALSQVSDSGIRMVIEKWIQELRDKLEAL